MQTCAALLTPSLTSARYLVAPRRPAVGRQPARRGPLAARAGALPPPPPPPEIVWQATGVPLLDELAGFSTLQAAGIHGAKLCAVTLVAVYAASVVLDGINSRLGRVKDIKGFNPVSMLLASAAQPAAALLPFYSVAYSATVASALCQVAAGKVAAQFNAACFGRGPQVLQSVKVATQLVQDCTEVVIIVGLAWAAVNLKDRVVAYVQERFLGGAANPTGMSRILLPVAGALNIGLYGAALLSGLAAFGVNTTPLLASLGASSVVIGLATQKILGDVASAITLYASPPFATGDQVKFLSGGALVVEGLVLAIEPMRTVLRLADGSTLYISNSQVVGWMVQNDSQKA